MPRWQLVGAHGRRQISALARRNYPEGVQPGCADHAAQRQLRSTAMALLRTFQNEEYWPEFSEVVVRDGLGDVDPHGLVPAALNEYEIEGLSGTAGRSGVGWFHVSAGDGPHQVILEVHDSLPDPPGAEWPHVMETPYRSLSGTIGCQPRPVVRPCRPSKCSALAVTDFKCAADGKATTLSGSSDGGHALPRSRPAGFNESEALIS